MAGTQAEVRRPEGTEEPREDVLAGPVWEEEEETSTWVGWVQTLVFCI